MQIFVNSVEEYLEQIPEDRRIYVKNLVETIFEHLPKGFQQQMTYGMIGWNIFLETYPDGYHCTPNTPLPFINVASQKIFIALYPMGIDAKPELLNWFVEEFPKYSKRKSDMGKPCIRFKKAEEIPFELIAELVKK